MLALHQGAGRVSDDFYPQRGPGELQRFLQEKRDELATLGVELQKAHDLVDDTEEAWTEHLDSVVSDLEEEVEAGQRPRLPFKDDILSIARRTGDGRSVWNTHRRAERAVKKYEQRISLIKTQISAAQSEAKL